MSEWVWIAERHVMTLQRQAGRGALDFEEGRLHLKDNAGELRWSNGEIEVLSRVVAKLPPQSRNFLDSHLT